MATLDSIAQELGYTRNELMQSMVKFALTNRDWREEGLTAHKRLPRYQENPGMIPKLRRHVGSYAVVEIKSGQVVGELFKDSKLLGKVNFDKYKLVPIDEWLASLSRKENPIMATRTPSPAQLAARERFAEMARSGALNRKRQIAAKKNPAKKTVSQKISQLVHEGYPQRQAVAVALTEQRAGKIKRNPSKTMKPKKISYESSLNRGVLKSYVVRDMEKNNDIAEFMSKSEAMKYARDYSDRHDVQVSVRSV
jgi:hypothetical protein